MEKRPRRELLTKNIQQKIDKQTTGLTNSRSKAYT